jgi:predicted dehydrogenase
MDGMKTYHWGILGLGRIAHKFAADLALLPNARLFAAGSRDALRAASFAEQLQIPYHFDSYRAFAACDNLDIAYVATPHSGHLEAALLCLERGIPVLCEKPLALNRQEAQRMVDAASANQTFLMEAIWTRFMPATLQMMTWLDQGLIGEVRAIKADFGFHSPFDPSSRLFRPDLGGGALLDIGIYPVSLALLVLGAPDAVQAGTSVGPSGVDEDTGIIFSYAHGAMAHLHVNIRYQTPTEAVIYGERGNIVLHSRWHHAPQLTLQLHQGLTLVKPFEYPGYGYQFEAAEVMQCLDQGLTESPRLPLSFSLTLMDLLDQVRRSMTS